MFLSEKLYNFVVKKNHEQISIYDELKWIIFFQLIQACVDFFFITLEYCSFFLSCNHFAELKKTSIYTLALDYFLSLKCWIQKLWDLGQKKTFNLDFISDILLCISVKRSKFLHLLILQKEFPMSHLSFTVFIR